jgi:hypothetical protein
MHMLAPAAIDECERLVVVTAIEPHHQDRHRAFAAEPDSPQQIVGAARVVTHDRAAAALQHCTRALEQVGFETSAAEQSRGTTVRANQHMRAGFAIRGAQGLSHGGEHQRFTAPGITREELTQGNATVRNATVIHELRYPSFIAETARHI